ncbi:hypothetical protein NDN01_14565 [Sphingomonas sp. QA11]|uniref:hypothetical protein n=1 Tax=Sphingomonas sp. QA11 TaxID=2950605 RepID=UPI002349DE9D|nr:hypothetical protein [Sphingomonas sp. QA11]WCM25288.1 hypothetical protein NDN01_14565 [Sphingomonas sp. QA11]
MQIAKPIIVPGNTFTALRLFAGSVWLTVATTLLCALLPVGLPQTSAVGSAFNPSNSVVALRSAEPASLLARTDAARAQDPDTGSALFAPAIMAALRFVPLAVVAFHNLGQQSLAALTPIGSAYPRGPPSRKT